MLLPPFLPAADSGSHSASTSVSSGEAVPNAHYIDLDSACFCSFLLLFHLTRLPLSPDPWDHFPKELCMREVLISGSAVLIHCFIQSLFGLLPPVNAWISTGKFAGPGPGI